MLRNLYYQLSPELRLTARKLYYLPIDFYEGITGKRHKYQPKKGDIYIGSGDFIQHGKQHVEFLKKYANLQPGNSVLDIGSGIGRTAVALTSFLNIDAKYEGFDVVKKGVDWCNKNIHKDFPNFNFLYAPLNNDLYNQDVSSSLDFKFPYEDEVFDQCFLFSVFTHMQLQEIQHYLKEISRVLKKDAYCLATFFVYDKDITEYQKKIFPFEKENYRLMSDTVKSANIAIDIQYLDQMIQNSGLHKVNFVSGYWRDFQQKSPDKDFQDIIILKK